MNAAPAPVRRKRVAPGALVAGARRPGAVLRVALDVRALQDNNYATRGIGQHTLFVMSVLCAVENVRLLPVGDPLMPMLREEMGALFDAPMHSLQTMAGDVYLNPSPLTHDTSLYVQATRRGMRSGAVVHDFIPGRNAELRADPEAYQAWHYLVRTLGMYDFLLPNSDFTHDDIRRVIPGYEGRISTLHCRSRFIRDGQTRTEAKPRAALEELGESGPYIFLGAADDPRKNMDVAIRAASQLRDLGLRLVLGGGLSQDTRKRLVTVYPDHFYLADPLFLPRLTDEDMRRVYEGAACVLVSSRDEGFSLPVAEGIAFGRPVVASNIPAHREQIRDEALLFEPNDAQGLVAAARHALTIAKSADFASGAYTVFDYAAEIDGVRALVTAAPQRTSRTAPPGLRIVGPAFDKPTGVGIYNRMMIEECNAQARDFTYVDLDGLAPAEFYDWLLANQRSTIVYVMGNNNLFHSRCFVALQNVPGACIMHDSRLFEFLLNRDGPHCIADLYNARFRTRPIDVSTVQDWQRERQKLPYSFLDPLVARADPIIVHSRILARHLHDAYGCKSVHTLPFALQMSGMEVADVMQRRRGRVRGPCVNIIMLGETDPTKGCSEIIYALKLLVLTGVDAELAFVGRSDEPYLGELQGNARRLGIESRVRFMTYVSRESYLEHMATADLVVQLRYALFGQVSEPLGDVVACGIPVVTTEDLAFGTGLEACCTVIPNQFSPLHIAEATRTILERGADAETATRVNGMTEYVDRLFQICQPGAA